MVFMMTRPDDMDPDDRKRLDPFAIARAVQALRYLPQFHTMDVVKHPTVAQAHPAEHDSDDFPDLIEAHLHREGLFLGLRGPLPGHVARGKRWAWHEASVDPTNGQGGDQGPTR